MKFFIWFACLFVASAITTLLKSEGILLGGIPTVILYAITFGLSGFLTKKWDAKHKNKENGQPEADQPVVIESKEKNEAEKNEQINAEVKGEKTKTGSFLPSCTKLIVITIAVCLVLFVVSWIGGYVCGEMKLVATRHYVETCTFFTDSSTLHSIGCGLETCRYCAGGQHYSFGENVLVEYSNFAYYSSVCNTLSVFETFAKVYLILLLVLAPVLLICLACRYKLSISIKKR